MRYFITGIDTDSGKTFVSAIFCEALKADYWKPVQAGLPRDADTVKKLITNKQTRILPERFLLNMPASPHASAKADGVHIALDDFKMPDTNNTLIIEGAGGCLVPLNDNQFVIDLIKALNTEVVLVADLYLGSINHTLLTLEALRNRNISLKGIVFNGDANPESERIILKHTETPCLLRISKENVIDNATVIKYADLLKRNWNG